MITNENLYGQIEYELGFHLGGTDVYLVYMPASKTLDAQKFEEWLKNQPRSDIAKLSNTVYLFLTENLKPMSIQVQVQRGDFKVNKPPLLSPAYDPACFGVT